MEHLPSCISSPPRCLSWLLLYLCLFSSLFLLNSCPLLASVPLLYLCVFLRFRRLPFLSFFVLLTFFFFHSSFCVTLKTLLLHLFIKHCWCFFHFFFPLFHISSFMCLFLWLFFHHSVFSLLFSLFLCISIRSNIPASHHLFITNHLYSSSSSYPFHARLQESRPFSNTVLQYHYPAFDASTPSAPPTSNSAFSQCRIFMIYLMMSPLSCSLLPAAGSVKMLSGSFSNLHFNNSVADSNFGFLPTL